MEHPVVVLCSVKYHRQKLPLASVKKETTVCKKENAGLIFHYLPLVYSGEYLRYEIL